MVLALQLNHEDSVWIDYGSGSPSFGLMVSIFTKTAICLDVPDVMNDVFKILNELIPQRIASEYLMSSLHLVGKDILRMELEDFPQCFEDLTHFTCFIGVEHGLTPYMNFHL
jgi:hypothetical protein